MRYSLRVKRATVIYGLSGGVLIAALRLIEYRFLVVEHSGEIYGALVASLFAGVGIWIGLTLTRKRDVVIVTEIPAPTLQPFAVNDAKVRELAITPRELEILAHIAAGMSNCEIADALIASLSNRRDRRFELLER
jgi:ATP/maltotriose-dependent transcriptional regulator MalT